jgi:hypothetical protein
VDEPAAAAGDRTAERQAGAERRQHHTRGLGDAAGRMVR